MDFRESLAARSLSLLLIVAICLELVAPAWAVPWWLQEPDYPVAQKRSYAHPRRNSTDPKMADILRKTRPELSPQHTAHVDPDLLPGQDSERDQQQTGDSRRAQTSSRNTKGSDSSQDHPDDRDEHRDDSNRRGPSSGPSCGSSSHDSHVNNRDGQDCRDSRDHDGRDDQECGDSRDHDNRDDEDCRDSRDDHDRDHNHHQGCDDIDDGGDRPDNCHRRHVQPELARIILPNEVGKPIHDWTRRTGFNGPLFAVADPNQPTLYTLDYGIVHRKTHTLSNPATHTVTWDFISPNPEGNLSARHSAGSIIFTYRSSGDFATATNAHYRVLAKVYDRISPHGRTITLEDQTGHLPTYETVAGVTARDIGQWTLRETVDGTVNSTTFTVVDPPNPTAEWSRRVEGRWETIIAPFAAYVNDEWLSRRKTIYFPTPTRAPIDRQCAANRRTVVEWHWRSKNSSWLNRTQFKSFVSVRVVYRTTGSKYSLATYVFDEAYPQGRLYRQETGDGTLANAPMAWGGSLPEYGDIQLEERINGVQTELFTLEGRRIDAMAQSKGRFYVDNGNLELNVNVDFYPETSPLKTGRWILELRDVETGQIVYTDTRQFNNAEKKSHLSFTTTWDGRGLGGVPIPIGSQVRAEVTVKGYRDPDAILAAIPSAAANRRKGWRNVPERQTPHARNCRHCHPDRRGRGPSGGSGDGDSGSARVGQGGQGPSGGQGASEAVTYNPDGTYGTWPPGYFDVNDLYVDENGEFQWPSPPGFAPGIGNPGDHWLIANADPVLGITHTNFLKMLVNRRFLYQTNPSVPKVDNRYQESPISVNTLAATERFERIKIGFVDEVTGASDAAGDPSDIYIHNLDAGYSIRLLPYGLPGPDISRLNYGWNNVEWWFNHSVEQVTVVHTPALSSSAIQLLSGASKNVATNYYGVAQSLGAADVKNPAVNQDINLGDGELQVSETDLAISTAGLPFHVTRYYLAHTDQTSFTDSPEQVQFYLGNCFATGDIYHDHADNWVWSFQEDLEMGEFTGGSGGNWTPTKITHRWADGRQDAFRLDQSSGIYRSVRPDVVAEIKQLDQDTYELTLKSKVKKRFRRHAENPGQPDYYRKFLKRSIHCYLVQELDRNNNALNYTWDSSGIRLQKVDDGRRTLATFTWADRPTPIYRFVQVANYYLDTLITNSPSGFQGPSNLRLTNLISIEDLSGRTVTYSYQAPDQDKPYAVLRYLQKVVQPGNRTIEYRYKEKYTIYDPGYSYLLNHYLGFPWESDLVEPAWAHTSPVLYTQLLAVKYEHKLESVLVNGRERTRIDRYSDDTALVNQVNQPGVGRVDFQNNKNAGLPASITRMITTPETGSDTQTWSFGTDQLKRVVAFTNPKNETTELSFDIANNLTSVLDALGRQTVQQYDQRRNLVAATDGLNHTTAIGYDDHDNPTSIQDPLGNTQFYEWDSNSNLISSTSAEGRTVTLTRDSRGKVTEARAPDGGTWNYEYDADGFLTGKSAPQTDDQPQRAHWGYTLDILKRRTAIEDPQQRVSQATYDERDRVTSTSLPATSGQGLQTGRPEATTVLEYDSDDLLTRVTDPIGRVTEYRYDDYLRMVEVAHISAGTTESVAYDPFNNVRTSTNENGDTTTYDYDGNNRVVAVHYPGAGTESYVYNAAGEITTMVKTDGVHVNYTYDPAGRLTRIEGKGKQIGYTYDDADRLVAMDDDLGQTRYDYTPDSNLQFLQKQDGKTLTFEFDANSRLRRMIDPDSEETTYEWNELNQLKSVQFGGASASYTYDISGNLVSTLFGNGMQATQSYDERNQLLNKTYSHPAVGPLLTVQYSHDNLGRRQAFRRTDPQGVQTRVYTYRTHGELIHTAFSGLGGTRGVDYSFDNNYNLTSNDHNGYSVNAADQLLGGNGFSQLHDGAGSVATLVRPDSRTTFKYDFRDQLLSAENADHSVTYDYDGDNIRARKTVDGEVTNYLTLGGQVLKEYDNYGNAGNAYLPGVAWRRNNDASDWNYYLTDGLGSVLSIVDNNGNSVARYDYSDYGTLLSSDGPLSEENVFRFTGEQFDAETGFYYLRNRYYQPEFGRFLQRDPIRYAGGSNMYSYCSGDPTNRVDPSGLEVLPPGMTVQEFYPPFPPHYSPYDGIHQLLLIGPALLDPILRPRTVRPSAQQEALLAEAMKIVDKYDGDGPECPRNKIHFTRDGKKAGYRGKTQVATGDVYINLDALPSKAPLYELVSTLANETYHFRHQGHWGSGAELASATLEVDVMTAWVRDVIGPNYMDASRNLPIMNAWANSRNEYWGLGGVGR